MRIRLLLVVLLFMQLASKAQSTTDAKDRYFESDALRARNKINEQPRYGGLTKTSEELEADKRLTAEMLRQYGTNQAAMQALVGFGWHYLATNHAPTAIKRFNQAWLLDSTAADVYYGFSAYLRQQGQAPEAEQFMEVAKRHDQDGKGVLRYYGSLAMSKEAKHDYAGAVAAYNQILELDANNPFANKKLGYWHMQQQDTARANQYLSRAIELNARDTVSYLNRGWLHYKQKQYPKAVADFTQAIRINPFFLKAYINRALANSDAGNHSTAITDWRKCLELAPARDKGQFYNLIGQASLKTNDASAACEAFQQALQWGETPAAEKEIRRLMKSSCR